MKENVTLQCRFWYDLEEFIASNGMKAYVYSNDRKMPVGLFYLELAKRDVGLLAKGIIANKEIDVQKLKVYFGYVGSNIGVFGDYLEDLYGFVWSEEGSEVKMRDKWGIEVDSSVNKRDIIVN